jgi:hypothetical protein
MGGKVAKKLGDGLMALFGYPLAHENDAERAVRATLSIQRSLAELNRKNEGTGRPALAARIAIGLGPVVVDAAGDIRRRAERRSAGAGACRAGSVVVTASIRSLRRARNRASVRYIMAGLSSGRETASSLSSEASSMPFAVPSTTTPILLLAGSPPVTPRLASVRSISSQPQHKPRQTNCPGDKIIDPGPCDPPYFKLRGLLGQIKFAMTQKDAGSRKIDRSPVRPRVMFLAALIFCGRLAQMVSRKIIK